MDEVSDPDEWARIHDGDREGIDYDRMVALSQADQQRLANSINAPRARREMAEAAGNWEEAANDSRAINEIEAFRHIA